jgi:NAD(P)H-hydrate epimerase
MVKPVDSYLEALKFKADVIAIGPGLGQARANEVRQLLERVPQPMVIDADGLNILAGNVHILGHSAGPRLLTPHPGEMQRLDPHAVDRSRRETVEAFIERRPLSYNTTGSPGMATGGMGDVLTGVTSALAGQGLELFDAARIGAWVCGRAAEVALRLRESEESLTPVGLIAHLGQAFDDLRAGCW